MGPNAKEWCRMRRPLAVMLGFGFLLFAAGWEKAPWAEEVLLVGRISHLEGDLLRYVPEDDDWVLAVSDAPVGPQDIFYSGEGTRAEFSFPTDTLVRSGDATQVEVVALEEDLAHLRVASGEVRFQNNSLEGVVRADTPYGYVVAPGGTSFDIYVGEESLEVVALKGEVQFIHLKDGYETRYPVTAGSSSLLADSESVEQGEGGTEQDWDRWNAERDQAIQRMSRVSSPYLPEGLQSEAHVLEENGHWERVPYQGGYQQMWRPTRVEVGWSPFTCGRWTKWYNEHVWIPYEPFGHVTHHYGGWVVVNGIWYWVPPPRVLRIRVLRWHPGRVLWIHTPQYIGWVPLAPHEVFYGFRYWGPGTVVLNQVNIFNIHIILGEYANIARPVIVNKQGFYSVKGRYHPVPDSERMLILNQVRPAPVIDKSVLVNVPNQRDRHRFVDVNPERKPHRTVIEQLRRQERERRVTDPRRLIQDVQKISVGKEGKEGRVRTPVMVNKMVTPSDVEKPHVVFKKRQLSRRPPGPSSKPEVPTVQRPPEGTPQTPDVKKPVPIPMRPRQRSVEPAPSTQGEPRQQQEIPLLHKGPRPETGQGKGKGIEKEDGPKERAAPDRPEVQRRPSREAEGPQYQRPQPKEAQAPSHMPKPQVQPEPPRKPAPQLQRPPKEEGEQRKKKRPAQPQQEEQQQRQ